ncbi:hypothetical protein SDJN03_09071, partial [Cucurbita argyrosperma subsp. sororia]
MLPSCFSHSAVSSTLSNDPIPPPLSIISCIYQTNLFNSPTLLTLTWSLSLSSHSLSLHSSPSASLSASLSTSLSLSPSSFSLFSPTSKSISLHNSHKLKLHWDFSTAKYTPNSAQPISSFYLAISCNGKLQFFLGDLADEFSRRVKSVVLPEESTLLSRREHVFERRNRYVSRAEFLGSLREIAVELCGGVLKVAVDGEVKLAVKRLAWKFRGNERFFIAGNAVDFFWDVFNWVKSEGGSGPGVFVFQIGEGGVWPEYIGAEGKLMKRSLSSAAAAAGNGSTPAAAFPALSPAGSSSSVLQWAEESSSDGGRSSCSSSSRSSGINGGFSLSLYAWRKD